MEQERQWRAAAEAEQHYDFSICDGCGKMRIECECPSEIVSMTDDSGLPF